MDYCRRGEYAQLLKETADKVQELLHGSELEEVLQQTLDEKARLSNYTIDKYDYLFRCTRLLSIRELLSVVYMFDVCRTAHRVAKAKNFCFTPTMVQTMEFSVEGIVHPFVEMLAKGIIGKCPVGIYVFLQVPTWRENRQL